MSGGEAVRVFQVHEGEDFFEQVAFVLKVAPDSAVGVSPPAVETFGVDTVHAIELKLTSFDLWTELLYHAHVFVFEKTTTPGWKNEHSRACMSKNEQFHIPLKPRAPPFMILPVHCRTGLA